VISATQFLTEISAASSDAPTIFRQTGVCLHSELIPVRSHHAINTPLPSPTRGTSCCVNRSYCFACLCLSLPAAPAPNARFRGLRTSVLGTTRPGNPSAGAARRLVRTLRRSRGTAVSLPVNCGARSAVFLDPRRFPTRGSSDKHEILSVTGCCAWHTNLYEVYRMSAMWQFNCDIKVPLLRFEPLRGRLDRALLPGLEIRQQHPLQVISKRQTDA
jgi:hypothetical protein